MFLKKVFSFVILGVMSSPLFVWAGSRLLAVTEHEVKINNLESDIKELKTMTWQIHWYHIKRNNIQAPKPPGSR